MTRATLLHVLDYPTDLGVAEVRELEQLAQAFPYCQTAHLLLAKAAHDQGTMLAGQRLRRAATYAADRSLLRRLIEQVAPEPLPAQVPESALPPVVEPFTEVAPTSEVAPPIVIEPAPAAVPEPLPAPLPLEPVAVPAAILAKTPLSTPPAAVAEVMPVVIVASPAVILPAPTVAVEVTPTVVAIAAEAILPPPAAAAEVVLPAPASAAAVTLPPPAVVAEVVAPVPAVVVEEAAPVAVSALPIAAVEPLPEATSISEMPGPEPVVLVEEQSLLPVESEVMTVPAVAAVPVLTEPVLLATVISAELPALPAPEATATTAVQPAEAVETPPLAVAEVAIAVELPDELPAQAPTIRPPVEVGEARFEFGLADALPAVSTYELPGLIDEWAASAMTRSMGTVGVPALVATPPPAPVFTPAAFTGDAVVGYAFGESSRLGLAMQLLDLLTAKAEAAESITAVVAAAQPQATALPPVGTFFEPDPLLLDHWATHRPAPPELPSTGDLINNFLKRQPRLTRPGMLPPAPGGQPDLSVRSTRAEPNLVSENLARIFIRQGKTARAIEIYEKLMVKHPEKMAYFTAQIQSLQPSA